MGVLSEQVSWVGWTPALVNLRADQPRSRLPMTPSNDARVPTNGEGRIRKVSKEPTPVNRRAPATGTDSYL